MKKTIWKVTLDIVDRQVITVPRGSGIMTVQMQHGKPCLWFVCDPSQPVDEKRAIGLYGTGHQLEDVCKYIATFQMAGGDMMWHVFEVRE